MSSAPTGEFEDEVWEMESDLPSLANQAAIELDDYILKQGKGFAAVRRLALLLAESATNGGGSPALAIHYDPITMGVVSRAIDELISDPGARPKEFAKVVEYATDTATRLRNVADRPEESTPDELAELRHRCLVLSESASEPEWASDEKDPRHRFRR